MRAHPAKANLRVIISVAVLVGLTACGAGSESISPTPDPASTTSTSPTVTQSVPSLLTSVPLPSGSSSAPFSSAIITSPTGPGSATPAPWPTRAGVNLSAFGARCDGKADDTQALVKALAEIPKQGKDIVIPAGICRVRTAGGGLDVGSGTTLRGVNTRATLQLETTGGWAALLHLQGSAITLQGLTLTRQGDFPGLLLNVGAVSTLRLRDVVLDGRVPTWPRQDLHGIMITATNGQRVKGVSMVGCTLKNLSFAMFQPSEGTPVVQGWTVDRSTFTGNGADDLEFNAPNSTMRDIRVTNSTFRDNRYPPNQHNAGFGVGLAHVTGAVIEGNTFSGYAQEPVHVEDRSSAITIANNSFVRTAMTSTYDWMAVMIISSGSSDVRVTGNTVDMRANTNKVAGVLTTGGGGAPPTRITITGNRFLLGPKAQAVDRADATALTISGNTTI